MGKGKENSIKISISIPADIYKKLTDEKKSLGISVSTRIANILKQYYGDQPFSGGEMIDYNLLAERILDSEKFKKIIEVTVESALKKSFESLSKKEIL